MAVEDHKDEVAVEDHNNLGIERKEDRGWSVPCTEGRVDGSLSS